jgi:tetratricopeptide (TPR) repeat protein
MRVDVADWHAAAGRHADAVRLYEEANEVDVFRRDLHIKWGTSLFEEERYEPALREFGVALLVPAALDPDHIRVDPRVLPPGVDPRAVPPRMLAALPANAKTVIAPTDKQRASWIAMQAACLKALGREQESRAHATRALELDPDCERARKLW